MLNPALAAFAKQQRRPRRRRCLDPFVPVFLRLEAFYGTHSSAIAETDFDRKSPWRMSAPRKRRQRKRLRDVDGVMASLADGLTQTNQACRALDRALLTWRNEFEMPAKDKYWVFSRKDRESGYRKGAHKVPKWTKYGRQSNSSLIYRVTTRDVPYGF